MTSIPERVALGQSSLTFSGHQNQVQGCLKHRALGTPRVSTPIAPRWAQLMLTLPVHSQPQHCGHAGPGTFFVVRTVLCIVDCLVASWSLPTPCHSTHTPPPSAVITTCVSRHGQCPLGSKIPPYSSIENHFSRHIQKTFFLIRVFFLTLKKTILNLNLN